jgi:large repetitive protein
MPTGTFYWHVQARDAAGNWSTWSSYRSITVLPPIPTAPVLVSPANALVTTNTTPTFLWESVLAGNSYQIQIDTVSTFIHPVQDQTRIAGVTYYIATTLPNGKYYWRVRAINANGESGTWSSVRSITISH